MANGKRQFEFGDEDLPNDAFGTPGESVEFAAQSPVTPPGSGRSAAAWQDEGQPTAELVYAPPPGAPPTAAAPAAAPDLEAPVAVRRRTSRWLSFRLARRTHPVVALGVGAAALATASLLLGKPAPEKEPPGDVARRPGASAVPEAAVSSIPPRTTRVNPTPAPERALRRGERGGAPAPDRMPTGRERNSASDLAPAHAVLDRSPVAPPLPAPRRAPAPPLPVETEFGIER